MNKYLEKIAELQKEAMKPGRVLEAAEKKGIDPEHLFKSMWSKADKHNEAAGKHLLGDPKRMPLYDKSHKVRMNAIKVSNKHATRQLDASLERLKQTTDRLKGNTSK